MGAAELKIDTDEEKTVGDNLPDGEKIIDVETPVEPESEAKKKMRAAAEEVSG
jgi:hypothetical protein